jgi:anti-sigma factor (TIGR02949 family)
MKLMQFGDNACARIRRYMDSYINNELLVETNHEVLRHLESCPSCTAEVETRTRIKSRLKTAVQSQSVPPELQARVREALRNQSHGNKFEWTRWALAAAALMIIGVATWVALPQWTRPPLPDLADRRGQDVFIKKVSASLSAVLKVGLGDHIHCSIFRKYPKIPPSVNEMAEKLGAAYQDLVPLVKSRVPEDYRIILAHQCGYQGRRFVHLTLANGSNLISLVITRKQPGESLQTLAVSDRPSGVAIYQAAAQNYDVAGFETDQFLAYVVSDLGAKQNLQIANSLAPPVHQFLAAIRS